MMRDEGIEKKLKRDGRKKQAGEKSNVLENVSNLFTVLDKVLNSPPFPSCPNTDKNWQRLLSVRKHEED